MERLWTNVNSEGLSPFLWRQNVMRNNAFEIKDEKKENTFTSELKEEILSSKLGFSHLSKALYGNGNPPT